MDGCTRSSALNIKAEKVKMVKSIKYFDTWNDWTNQQNAQEYALAIRFTDY